MYNHSINHQLARTSYRRKRSDKEPVSRLSYRQVEKFRRTIDRKTVLKQRFWEDLRSGKFLSMVKESSKGQFLSSSLEAFNILKPLFADEDDVEKMFFVFLDQRNSILSIENLFKGSIAGAAIYPREVIKKVIRLKANSIVLAHNHPSGDTLPSKEDKAITMRLMIAAYSIDVMILDHIIIGDNYYSMADEGLIRQMIDNLPRVFNGGRYVQSFIES